MNTTETTASTLPDVYLTGNSFPVKDSLKSLGCKWDGWRKCWTAPAGVAGKAQELIDAASPKKEIPADVTGEHVGTVGEKITAKVKVTFVREYETEFNRKKVVETIALFEDEAGRVLKWKSSAMPNAVELGAHFTITGTVKAHEVRDNVRQTALIRCKIEGVAVIAPTHKMTLFCDAKASADGFAFCDGDGNVIEYGNLATLHLEGRKYPDFFLGYCKEQSNAEVCAALIAFDFARRVKEAVGAPALALTFNFDAQWMTGMVGKAKCLRDFAKKHGLKVEMNWIAGTENPADEWTTAAGAKTVAVENLAAYAAAI